MIMGPHYWDPWSNSGFLFFPEAYVVEPNIFYYE